MEDQNGEQYSSSIRSKNMLIRFVQRLLKKIRVGLREFTTWCILRKHIGLKIYKVEIIIKDIESFLIKTTDMF